MAAASALRGYAEPSLAKELTRFFKCGPGEYGEGDVFHGVTVPNTRRVAREFKDLPLGEVEKLIRSRFHEERLLGLLILVGQFKRADGAGRTTRFEIYLAHVTWINGWDLVDVSAEHVVGGHLADKDRHLLDELAGSEHLWSRRIAIMATFHFIRRGEYEDTLRVARRLLKDPHDLIHKATGWMLREVGNRDREVEEGFLRVHYRGMPRTMLRYAIEAFPEPLRQAYLKGEY